MKRRSATPNHSTTKTSTLPQVVQETQGSSMPFPYEDYLRVRQALLAAMRGPRFYAVLVGGSGMGKTSMLRDIMTSFEPHRNNVIYLSSSRLSIIGVANFLAHTLHMTPRRSYIETVRAVTEAINAQPTHMLLWIDEVDQVDIALLQEVRMLAEGELAAEQLFSVVLSGLQPFTAKLDSIALFPLKRRIGMHLKLSGLRKHELEPFLVHRFGTTQAKRIQPDAYDDLFERTLATPAIIESVVRHALQNNHDNIKSEDIRVELDTAGL